MDGFTNVERGILFLIQTGVGILANSYLLCLYDFNLIMGHMLRPKDLIVNQMVLANFLVLVSKGIPQTMAAFGLNFFLDDCGCKLVFYLHRVGRGVSLNTTCLLSGFQAITLCPNFSRWMELRMRFPKTIGFICSLCWILHFLLNINVLMTVTGPLKSKNFTLKNKFDYCSDLPKKKVIGLYSATYFCADLIFLGLMIWASGSMVLVLHRHKKRVQHIHSSVLFSRPSHEDRATRTILVLVSIFVSFYFASSVLTLYLTLVENPGQGLMDTSILVASCFSACSPFVLGHDTCGSWFPFACCMKKTHF